MGDKRDYLISLSDRPVEERRRIAAMGGVKQGERRKERRAISEVYAKVLAEKYDIDMNGKKQKIDGSKMLANVVIEILKRNDSSSVSMIKEMREALEGSNINFNGTMATSEMSPEEYSEYKKNMEFVFPMLAKEKDEKVQD